MKIKSLKIVSLLAVVVVLVTVVSSAYAANPTTNTRPGWGFGDINHIHTGPPGQSVNPGNNFDVTQSNNAVVSNNIHPSLSPSGSATAIVSVVTNLGSNILGFFGI